MPEEKDKIVQHIGHEPDRRADIVIFAVQLTRRGFALRGRIGDFGFFIRFADEMGLIVDIQKSAVLRRHFL